MARRNTICMYTHPGRTCQVAFPTIGCSLNEAGGVGVVQRAVADHRVEVRREDGVFRVEAACAGTMGRARKS